MAVLSHVQVRSLNDLGERVLAIHVQDLKCGVCESVAALRTHLEKLEQCAAVDELHDLSRFDSDRRRQIKERLKVLIAQTGWDLFESIETRSGTRLLIAGSNKQKRKRAIILALLASIAMRDGYDSVMQLCNQARQYKSDVMSFLEEIKRCAIENKNPISRMSESSSMRKECVLQEALVPHPASGSQCGLGLEWRKAIALGDFNASEYGCEYASLHQGHVVDICTSEAENQGYVYGKNSLNECGWFPSSFISFSFSPAVVSFGCMQAPSAKQVDRVVVVSVDLIHYSQNSCSDHFIDGRPLEKTLDLLNEGLIDPLDPPFALLEVARLQDGSYISKDHRRLLCFKKHQEHVGRPVSTRVRIIADVYDKDAFEKLCDRYDPRNEGRSIRVRHRPT